MHRTVIEQVDLNVSVHRLLGSLISVAVPDDDVARTAAQRYPFHRERDPVLGIERIPVYIEKVIGAAAAREEERIAAKGWAGGSRRPGKW